MATSCCLRSIQTLPVLTHNHADLLRSSVKQRKLEEQNQQLIQDLLQERKRRQLLQLGWASLENTITFNFLPLADARCHLMFTARSSFFKVCVQTIFNLACIFVWVCSPWHWSSILLTPVDAHLSICLDTAQNDMRDWMRGNFVKALNVDISCVRSLLEVV
jgi:hypothetical protein